MKKEKIIRVIIGIGFLVYIILNPSFLNKTTESFNETKKVVKESVGTGDFSIYFTDVGQADSILIKSGDKYALIDAGNEEDGEKLVSYYQKLGVEKFDFVVATHPHEDHIGGMDDIIKNFSIGKFLMPNVYTTTKTFENMLDALDVKSLSYITPKEDSTYYLNDAKLIIMYVGDDNSNLNDASIIVKVVYGQTSFLLTGDASSSIENKILNKNLSSTVLKVGHHGSNYSTSDEFLEKVNPEYAIISVGKNNSYNHPSKNIINKLENKKIDIYRTDEDGTIIIKSDKTNISVDKEETDTNGN